MLSDEDLIREIRASFESRAQSASPPSHLADTVRKRVVRRRTATVGAMTACVVAIGGGVLANSVAAPARHSVDAGTRSIVLSGYTFTIAKNAVVGDGCIGASSQTTWVKQWLPTNPVGSGVILRSVEPSCVAYQFAFTTDTPTPTQVVSDPGQPTVYIIGSAGGTRTGYVKLSADQVVALATLGRASDVPHTLVGRVPAGTDQSVLVALLRQSPAKFIPAMVGADSAAAAGNTGVGVERVPVPAGRGAGGAISPTAGRPHAKATS